MTNELRSEDADTKEMDALIEAAARAAEYTEGFGVTGCDLTSDEWWPVYTRQNTEEQRSNNRLGECLFTCAKVAKALGVVVPREYVLHDAAAGEHLERPNMVYLRHDLIANRRIGGVIFPALDRLSREPVNTAVIEFEMDNFGVRYHYADAPNGSDPVYQRREAE